MSGLTVRIAGFIAGLDRARIPGEAAATVQRGITDCFGVLFAGRDEPVVALAAEFVGVAGASGHLGRPPVWSGDRDRRPARARVLGDRGWCAAADAAFLNAVAAHALDYDDTGLDGHPSVVLAPVVLAQSECLDAAGERSIAAYVAGYETWAELVGRDEDSHHGKGWHPTAVFGTVAAAAAGASLARLDAAATTHALGIAASMSAGLVANFGSMTKPLQVGFAARNGLIAAGLAARGVTASPDALEHPRGLLAALSPAGRVRLDGPIRAGAPWQIVEQGLNIKRYPVCYAAHRAVDAAISLRARLAQPPPQGLDEIDSIVVELGRVQASMLRSHAPTTVLDAKFSVEFAVAAALSFGRLGLAELAPSIVDDPVIRALAARVRVEPTDQRDPEDPLFAPFDRVRLRLRDGRTLESTPVRWAKGHAKRPLSEDELREKFLDCAQPALGEPQALAWWRSLMAFESGGVRSLPQDARVP